MGKKEELAELEKQKEETIGDLDAQITDKKLEVNEEERKELEEEKERQEKSE